MTSERSFPPAGPTTSQGVLRVRGLMRSWRLAARRWDQSHDTELVVGIISRGCQLPKHAKDRERWPSRSNQGEIYGKQESGKDVVDDHMFFHLKTKGFVVCDLTHGAWCRGSASPPLSYEWYFGCH